MIWCVLATIALWKWDQELAWRRFHGVKPKEADDQLHD